MVRPANPMKSGMPMPARMMISMARMAISDDLALGLRLALAQRDLHAGLRRDQEVEGDGDERDRDDRLQRPGREAGVQGGAALDLVLDEGERGAEEDHGDDSGGQRVD